MVTLFGHVRSVSTTGINGEYFSNGIFFGCMDFGAMVFIFRVSCEFLVVKCKNPLTFSGSEGSAAAVMRLSPLGK